MELTPELFDERIEPLGKNLYLVIDEKHRKYGDLYLTNKSTQLTRVARIVKRGEEVPEKFKVGMKVMITYYVGTVLNLPGYKVTQDRRMVIPYDHIFGILHEPEDEEEE